MARTAEILAGYLPEGVFVEPWAKNAGIEFWLNIDEDMAYPLALDQLMTRAVANPRTIARVWMEAESWAGNFENRGTRVAVPSVDETKEWIRKGGFDRMPYPMIFGPITFRLDWEKRSLPLRKNVDFGEIIRKMRVQSMAWWAYWFMATDRQAMVEEMIGKMKIRPPRLLKPKQP